MFIDRAGAKVGLIEQHSRNSKASLSVVMEQVNFRPNIWQNLFAVHAAHVVLFVISAQS